MKYSLINLFHCFFINLKKSEKLKGELNEAQLALSREREIHESNLYDLQSKFENQINEYEQKLISMEVT
jgi:hypothetical protein